MYFVFGYVNHKYMNVILCYRRESFQHELEIERNTTLRSGLESGRCLLVSVSE